MYLSDKSLDVEIVSSKSSEMNVLIPKGNGDYVSAGWYIETRDGFDQRNFLFEFQTEKPIPEQFKTKIDGDSLTTICVESLG